MSAAREIMTRARELERLLARRRKQVKLVTDLDDQVRIARKLLRDLTEEPAGDVYKAPEV